MTNFFDGEIALFKESDHTKESALKKLSTQLYTKSFVTDDFYEQILKREKNFPTGLIINGIGVAIPHTDSQFVRRSQIAFLSLTNPVEFYEMGTNSTPVEVRIVFMLALKEPHEQLTMLQNLIAMFQKQNTLAAFLEIETKTEYRDLLKINHLI